MLASRYSFTVSEEGNVQKAVLIQTATGLEKEFEMVAKSIVGLAQHMESLTDDICDAFFPKIKK